MTKKKKKKIQWILSTVLWIPIYRSSDQQSGWKHVPLSGVLSSAYHREIHATRIINKYRLWQARLSLFKWFSIKIHLPKGISFHPNSATKRLLFNAGGEIKSSQVFFVIQVIDHTDQCTFLCIYILMYNIIDIYYIKFIIKIFYYFVFMITFQIKNVILIVIL